MSNKSKHTPGPWRISGCQLGNKLLIEHGGEGEFSPAIGSVYTDGGRLPQQANAKLIAAAPDLLECCLTALAHYECDGLGEYDSAKQLRQAISKATGAALDYSEYSVTVSDDPEYYGIGTREQVTAIADSIQKLIEGQFPGIQVKRTSDGGASAATTGPDLDRVEAIDYWVSQNWTAAL